MFLKVWLLILPLFSFLPNVSQGFEVIGDLKYSADQIHASLILSTLTLTGHVEIFYKDFELKSDSAVLNDKDKTIKAKGNIVFKTIDGTLFADEALYHYETRTGTFQNAKLISDQVYFESDIMKQTGPDSFEADNAFYTTCSTCPPSWSIKAKKLKTNLKESIEVSWPSFRILNVPIFIFPKFIFPLNTRRKTGFLPPEVGFHSERLGFYFAQPFFWNMGRSYDSTSKLYYYLNSGPKVHLNVRKVFNFNSQAEFNGAYFYDTKYEDHIGIIQPTHRWFGHYIHSLDLPFGLIQKTDLKLVNETYYLSDFPEEIPGHQDPAISNKVSITKHFNTHAAWIDTTYNTNLIKDDPQSSNEDSVHKLPEFRWVSGEKQLLKKLSFNWDNAWASFYRKNGSFDHIQLNPGGYLPKVPSIGANTQTFDKTLDLIRTGQRLHNQFRVTHPYSLGDYAFLKTSLLGQNSIYFFDSNLEQVQIMDTANRNYLEGQIELKTQISKVYSDIWKHKIEPVFLYQYGSILNQTNHVFFQGIENFPYHRRFEPISDVDYFQFRHGIQFDEKDRLFNANILHLKLNQYWIKKNKTPEGQVHYSRPIRLWLYQAFDFSHQDSSNPDPWSNFEAGLNWKTGKIESSAHMSYFYKAKAFDASFFTKFIYKPGTYLHVGYVTTSLINRNYQVQSETKTLGFGAAWKIPYMHFSGYSNYSLTEKTWLDWSLENFIQPPGKCWEFGIRLFQRLDIINPGFPSASASFRIDFGPKNPRLLSHIK